MGLHLDPHRSYPFLRLWIPTEPKIKHERFFLVLLFQSKYREPSSNFTLTKRVYAYAIMHIMHACN